jgi:hypothetical protein
VNVPRTKLGIEVRYNAVVVRHASARATVYRRNGDVIVVGEQELDDGMKVAGPPFLRLPSRSPVEVGAAVSRALSENRSSVVMADEEVYDRTWRPVLDAAGVSSNAEFHRGLCAAKVSASGDRIEVIAAENLGSDRGIAQFGSPLVLRGPTPEELGEAVLRQLDAAAAPP